MYSGSEVVISCVFKVVLAFRVLSLVCETYHDTSSISDVEILGKCPLNYHNFQVHELSDHFHLDIAVLDKAIRLVAIFVFSSLVT